MDFNSRIKKHWGIIFIGALMLTIFIGNFKPGTYLLGWDSLSTEFAPALAIKRALFAGWQEYQSFGLVAGMAHAADLFRAVVMWFASSILPQSISRYTFHLAMAFIGALGMYKLLEFAGFTSHKKSLAVLGGVAYILNFNSIQMMYLPFEPFSIFLASLPWQVWIFLRVMTATKLTRRDWALFALINVCATSSYVAQQLFVVYMLVLASLGIGYLIQTRSRTVLIRGILAALFILAINLFWILPQIYFLATAGDVVTTAKINQISTQDILFRNRDHGNILDFLTSTGFFYSSTDKNGNLLFALWHTWRQNFFIIGLLILTGIVTLLGILKRTPYRGAFAMFYLLTAFALLMNTFPFAPLNDFIRQNGFINQIFRSPFTKFSIPAALIETYFFVSGILLVIDFIQKFTSAAMRKTLGIIFIAATFAIVFVSALPAFMGNYFAPTMKVHVPDEYIQTMNYFKTQDKNARIALLPDYTYWGWFYTNWGYNGSGFLWYGIEQPIISRTFDVWSTKSESYYWELKNAVDSEDAAGLNRVLDKYSVDYIIFDHSLQAVVSSQKSIDYGTLETLVSHNSQLKLVKQWKSISIYKVSHALPAKNFVSATRTLPNIGPEIRLTNSDTAYQTYGTYQTDPQKQYTAYFPFLDLQTQTDPYQNQWNFEETPDSWQFFRTLPFNPEGYTPSVQSGSMTVGLYSNNESTTVDLPYTVTVDGKTVRVQFPKLIVDSFTFESVHAKDCYTSHTSKDISESNTQDTYTVATKNGTTGCFSVEDPHLEQRYGYIVKLTHKNIMGQPLFFYVLDQTKDQPYVEDRLSQNSEYYVVGSKFTHGLGYSFSFQENSYATIPSKNQIKSLDVFLMPYDILKQVDLYLAPPTTVISTATLATYKNNYYTYTVGAKTLENASTLILHQAYSAGWHAYTVVVPTNPISQLMVTTFPFIFGKQTSKHVIVNNWENGWDFDTAINSHEEVVIMYVPQYLEYLGLIAIFILLDNLFDPTKKVRHSIQSRLLVRKREGRTFRYTINLKGN